MRILVVAPQPFYQERGTPIATRLLLEALQAAGHSVDVLTYHVGEDPKLAGVRVFRAPAVPFVHDVPIGFSLRKLVCDLALLWRLITLTRRYRYDVLHAVEEAVFLSLLVRAFAGARSTLGTDKLDRLGCRVVYDMDSSLPEQLVGKYAALRFVDGVLRRFERFAVRTRISCSPSATTSTRARELRDEDTRRRRRGRFAARRRPSARRSRELAPRPATRRRARLVHRQSRALPGRRSHARRDRHARVPAFEVRRSRR
jgi:hypothetical protein